MEPANQSYILPTDGATLRLQIWIILKLDLPFPYGLVQTWVALAYAGAEAQVISVTTWSLY
jgi:hypothetical protein